MTQQTDNSEVQTTDSLITRLNNYINEEKLIKDLTSVQLSRIKLLDDYAEEVNISEKKDVIKSLLEENLLELTDSLVSRYLLGILALLDDIPQDLIHIRTLLEDLRKSAKWTIVDHIADRILKQDANNRFALRAKVESTERLKGKKELRPYLERLARIDRKNPDINKKYALSIFDEDPKKAIVYLKQAGETYARINDYKNLEEIWNLVITHDHHDMSFFERIERILVGNREKTRVAAYFVSLVEPYKNDENWGVVIIVLKKILEYEPTSPRDL